MHYCLLLITEQFPTDKVIDDAIAQYNDDEVYGNENVVYPPFMWDWWQVGGRYAGRFKLSVSDEETYRWNFYETNPRCGRLFRSYLLEDAKKYAEKTRDAWRFREEDYFTSMGFRDGYLYVDGGKISDITNVCDFSCYCFVDRRGQAFSRSRWDGDNWTEEDADFDNKLKIAFAESKDCYACVIDIHN